MTKILGSKHQNYENTTNYQVKKRFASMTTIFYSTSVLLVEFGILLIYFFSLSIFSHI